MVALFLHSLWQQLDSWDKQLFIKLNSAWTNPLFDAVLPYVRETVFWAPLYIFILAFIMFNYGKKGWQWSIAFLCTAAITDMVSTLLLKETVERLRPCQDPAFFMHVRLLLKHCTTINSYSFTSSDAANYFGLATFVSITFYPTFKRWIYLSYIWAIFISYAQVYVGVNYPLDVLGGAGIGVLAGLLTAWVFNKKSGTLILDK